MKITVYTFSKRVNSTKQPATTTGTEIDAVLKEPCNKEAPVFQLNAAYADINYIKAFNNYYWVNNGITFLTNDIIEVPCIIDALATYKSNIGLSEEYILRSSNESAYTWGRQVTDTYYPTLRGMVVKEHFRLNPFSITSGWYCVGILNTAVNTPANAICTRGAVSYLAMTSSQINDLLVQLMNLEYSVADINPLQFISSCVYIPDTNELEGSNVFTIDFAVEVITFNYSNDPYDADGVGTIAFGNMTIPQNTFSDRGSYFNFSPYFTVRCFGGVFGVFDVPLDEFTNSSRIMGWAIDVDLPTGRGTLKFYSGRYPVEGYKAPTQIQAVSGQIGVPVQISQITTGSRETQYNVLGSIAGSFGKAVTLNIGGAVSDLVNAVKSSWESMLPTVQSSGTNGTLVDLSQQIEVLVYEATPVAENIEDVGRPVYRRFTINTIPGFIQCMDANIQLPATMSIIDNVRNYMNSGFFYE